MLNAIQKPRVAVDTVQRIVEIIRDSQFTAGDRLPSERTLSEQLKVSRTSVRDAIRRLETMGLLESRPGLGTFVKEPASGMLQATLIPRVLADEAKLKKIFEVREIIEVEAATRAAERATPAQIEAIQRWAEEVEVSIARNDSIRRSIADVEFHRQIVIATDNEVLVDLVDSMASLLREMRAGALNVPGAGPEVTAGHRAIVEAIAAHDPPAARQAMQRHLDNVSARWRAFMATQNKAALAPPPNNSE
jgi:GntR family transcriptional repressor for pyruvate dehydrogenase complex